VITVGGTNGKGSTCAYLEAIYGFAGYRVGCYTSPHLLAYNERVRVDRLPVDDDSSSAWLSPGSRRPDRRPVRRGADLLRVRYTGCDLKSSSQPARWKYMILEVGIGRPPRRGQCL
jgi:folylpolyglutamate synthase/dihydropteroate synthase